jgi:hypothetical protein
VVALVVIVVALVVIEVALVVTEVALVAIEVALVVTVVVVVSEAVAGAFGGEMTSAVVAVAVASGTRFFSCLADNPY